MERTPLFILDASVAVKWYVHEAGSAKALKIREDYVTGKIDLLAPELIAYEVANALRFHPNATERLGSVGVRSLYKMQLVVEGLQDSVIDNAMHISYLENITFYDAVYLALAEEEDAKLITADEQLVGRLKRYRNRVVLLDNLTL